MRLGVTIQVAKKIKINNFKIITKIWVLLVCSNLLFFRNEENMHSYHHANVKVFFAWREEFILLHFLWVLCINKLHLFRCAFLCKINIQHSLANTVTLIQSGKSSLILIIINMRKRQDLVMYVLFTEKTHLIKSFAYLCVVTRYITSTSSKLSLSAEYWTV